MEGKLLIIDSKFDESRKLKVNLENIGYTVFISESLNDGLLIAKTNNIDLLVYLDIDESIKTVKTVNDLYMPILGIFSEDLKDKLSEYRAYLDDYIFKPLDKEQLYLKIKNLIRINILQNAINYKNDEIRKLSKQLDEINLIDRSTGLFNAFYLKSIIQHECASSKRYGYKLSGMAFSIDITSKDSEKYNHALQEAIYIIKKSIRQNDTLARLDSETFYILLPHTGFKDSVFVAEKLRRRVSEYKFKSSDHITVSIGVTGLNDIDSGIRKEYEMLEQAVEALKKAKSNGGNRVECY